MSRANRYIAEVRGGLALFFNCTIDVEDGWWWGSDEDPWQWGPFASCEEALADARRGAERFKLVRWHAAERKLVETDLEEADVEALLQGHVSPATRTAAAKALRKLRRPDRPLPPRGHLIVIDTGGKVVVKTGERRARGSRS
jgi:hypothetical protein